MRPVSSAGRRTSSTLSAAQETGAGRRSAVVSLLLSADQRPHAARSGGASSAPTRKLLRRWLVKLDNLHLVELRARLGARLRVHAPISWREDGPIRRTYEQQVREEFMRSSFLAQDEALHFRSAELSEASRHGAAAQARAAHRGFQRARGARPSPARAARNAAWRS